MATKKDYGTAAVMASPLFVFLVFLALRLTKITGWSWWWVTSPLWIVAAITILTALVILAVLNYKIWRLKH